MVIKTQLSNLCRFEVSFWWCPLTDLETYFICVGGSLIVIGVICLITKMFSKKNYKILDRDYNAAKNILTRGKELASMEKSSSTSKQKQEVSMKSEALSFTVG